MGEGEQAGKEKGTKNAERKLRQWSFKAGQTFKSKSSGTNFPCLNSNSATFRLGELG